MSVPEIHKLRHRTVEVWAHGILYKGVLDGVDEESVYLKGITCYHTIPLDRVTVIRLPGEGRLQLRHRASGLSAEFFAFQPGEEDEVESEWDASDAHEPPTAPAGNPDPESGD